MPFQAENLQGVRARSERARLRGRGARRSGHPPLRRGVPDRIQRGLLHEPGRGRDPGVESKSYFALTARRAKAWAIRASTRTSTRARTAGRSAGSWLLHATGDETLCAPPACRSLHPANRAIKRASPRNAFTDPFSAHSRHAALSSLAAPTALLTPSCRAFIAARFRISMADFVRATPEAKPAPSSRRSSNRRAGRSDRLPTPLSLSQARALSRARRARRALSRGSPHFPQSASSHARHPSRRS